MSDVIRGVNGGTYTRPRVKREPHKNICIHLGDHLESVKCSTCRRSARVKVYRCEVHGRCTLAKRVAGVEARCVGCADYQLQ